MAAHNELGKWGEDIAATFLQEKGYIILERDWHSGHRDIDIIARKGNALVFVEVKTRRNSIFVDPEQAVDYRKMRNLRGAMNHYMKFKQLSLTPQFDIVTVVGTMEHEPEINHIEDIRII